jgi:hypothetical protein
MPNMPFNLPYMKTPRARRGRLARIGVRLLNSRYALGLLVGVVLCGVLTVRAWACHGVRHTDARAPAVWRKQRTHTHTQDAQPCFV